MENIIDNNFCLLVLSESVFKDSLAKKEELSELEEDSKIIINFIFNVLSASKTHISVTSNYHKKRIKESNLFKTRWAEFEKFMIPFKLERVISNGEEIDELTAIKRVCKILKAKGITPIVVDNKGTLSSCGEFTCKASELIKKEPDWTSVTHLWRIYQQVMISGQRASLGLCFKK